VKHRRQTALVKAPAIVKYTAKAPSPNGAFAFLALAFWIAQSKNAIGNE
jgi:hypothetical protein